MSGTQLVFTSAHHVTALMIRRTELLSHSDFATTLKVKSRYNAKRAFTDQWLFSDDVPHISSDTRAGTDDKAAGFYWQFNNS
jgi:hypothetical protein